MEGNAIYVSGFSSRDTDDSSVWGNWASMGMTLIKFDSLPTTSGWPSAAWTTDPIYALPSNDTTEFPEPYGFAVNRSAGLVGVTMLFNTSNSPAPTRDHFRNTTRRTAIWCRRSLLRCPARVWMRVTSTNRTQSWPRTVGSGSRTTGTRVSSASVPRVRAHNHHSS